MRRIVIVSPHLDDSVVSCWTLLDSELDVSVVNVFTAGPAPGVVTGWDRDSGVDSATRMEQRRAEDASALALAGRTAVNLGLRELMYGTGLVPPEALAPHVLDPEAAVFAPAGAALRAELIHPDHVEVREAVLALRPDASLYADQPYCRFMPDFELRGPLAKERAATPVALTPGQRERKSRALADYAVELAKLERIHGPFSNPEALEYELFWLTATIGLPDER